MENNKLPTAPWTLEDFAIYLSTPSIAIDSMLDGDESDARYMLHLALARKLERDLRAAGVPDCGKEAIK